MNWRARLAGVTPASEQNGLDGELTKLTKGGFVGFVSTQAGPFSEKSHGAIRERLSQLADLDGFDRTHVHRLDEDELAAYADLPDATVRRCLQGLVEAADMDAGRVPARYTHRAHCARCGPIWWHVVEDRTCCPWCFLRSAGKVIPRPADR